MEEEAGRERKRLLVVEDDAMLRDPLVRNFEVNFEGAKVESAASGTAAINRLEAMGPEERPHLIITDHNLGAGPTGVDLTRHVADKYSGIKVVGMSGAEKDLQTGEALSEKFGAAGAVGFSVKLDLKKLQALVREHLGLEN